MMDRLSASTSQQQPLLTGVPFEQLLAGPEEHVLVSANVVEPLFEILDAMGHTAEVRMDGDTP